LGEYYLDLIFSSLAYTDVLVRFIEQPKALRGAGGSYGIMTAIRFRTELAPREATNFGIQWNMNEEDFAQTLIKFQAFCMSDVPAQLGITVNLRKSKQSGKLLFDFAGAWYGEGSAFDGVVQPFLSQMVSRRLTKQML
jgi:hypothetical protein